MSKVEVALQEFIESGALATNQCPNYLRDAYFRAGFRACEKLLNAYIDSLRNEEGVIATFSVSADCGFDDDIE